MLSALLFGLAPALQLARIGVGDTLKQGSRSVAGGAHQRMRRVLVGIEVALAFVLVVSNGLLLRSFTSILNTDPGFVARGAITASVELPTVSYGTDAGAAAFFARALEGIRALPGVREAGFGSDLPWTGYDENTGFAIIGRPIVRDDEPEGRYHFITTGYATRDRHTRDRRTRSHGGRRRERAGGVTREREPREQVLVHAERCRRRACADLGS